MTRLPLHTRHAGWLLAVAVAGTLAGCGSDDDDNNNGTPPAALACNDTMKTAFVPDANTSVLLVRSYKKGDALTLGTTTATTPTAAADLCVVKLLVGPGNPGPADAPSTSPGIGIEVWLPAPTAWNNRLHVLGGGGWQGGVHTSLTALAGTSRNGLVTPAEVAGVEGAVSATTDTGHANATNGGSFAMLPDGSINTALWNDFSQRSLHEMAVKTKALTLAYYGRAQRYAYFDGFSTGGRQGHKLAQVYPEDYDGILAGAPAFNWTRFITGELYPQVVQQRDLAGVNLTSAQLGLVSNAAINACDVVGGQHLGYIPDPSQCTYDPTKDVAVLCAASGGTNATASCVSTVQATAINKIWYGQTNDGSVPIPAADNGFAVLPTGNQRWYGLTRGTDLNALAGANPFPISTDVVALESQDATLAQPLFINAKANGANRWRQLTYADLAAAGDKGLALQTSFANINTDNPDLSRLRDRGAKMVMYHGMSDVLIPPQGSINYYNRVATQMGGIPAIQNFYRFYLVPGMTHGLGNGTSNTAAVVPLPTAGQLYQLVTDWVEKGTAPGRLDIASTVTTTAPVASSRPLCVYPLKATYTSGSVTAAASYTCS